FKVSPTNLSKIPTDPVVTGASEGIGRAYAVALAERGLNVVIMSRTKEKLDQLAEEIGEKTGQKVKVIVADFTKDDIYGDIEEQLQDLNVGVLVNNVGALPTFIPCRFLDTKELDTVITKVINCNVKTMMKMCRIVLPGMENRRKGLIVNISSGIVCVPIPLYTLYAASKVFVERFSRGLQAEYKDKGILIQAITPFGVSTRLAGYQKANIVTFMPDDFVKTSLQYLRAGDKTAGSVSHTILGWFLQSIPHKLLHSELAMARMCDFVKKKTQTRIKISTTKVTCSEQPALSLHEVQRAQWELEALRSQRIHPNYSYQLLG
ncbi:17-beta-hydroxysteroid dehydrogenase type 3, partial [Austrofundulus limnaeus]|uniref:17-beta-hydroxysteroid dehydrogenase type 3 n=1 Tax=Austrofundulus limnaeus TaxID=52670 RepID=A0A2I4AR86_AUSLI